MKILKLKEGYEEFISNINKELDKTEITKENAITAVYNAVVSQEDIINELAVICQEVSRNIDKVVEVYVKGIKSKYDNVEEIVTVILKLVSDDILKKRTTVIQGILLMIYSFYLILNEEKEQS